MIKRLVAFLLVSLERPGDLVGAGGGLQAAGNAVKALDDLIHLHSFQQMGDAQQISRAASCDLDITDGIIIIIHRDGIPFGAHTLGFINESFHCILHCI